MVSSMSVTVREVAQEAGVSQATAARALGGYGYVGPTARRNVLLAAARLGYRPNNAARTLASGSSSIIGLIVGDIENAFFAPLARGLADIVEDYGYTLLVANSDEDVNRELRAVDSLRAHRVDGLVVAPASNMEGGHLVSAQAAGTAVLQVDRVVSGLKIDSVVTDALSGASVGVEQLIAHGHRRVGIVIDSLQTPLSSMVMRLRGWRDTLQAAGLPSDDSLISMADGNKDDGYRATMRLLIRSDRPTALFSASNLMTIGALRAIRELGLSMPDDLALVAFDDLDLLSVYEPPVTVVAQPVRELGREAGKLLLARLQGDRSRPKHAELPTELIVRSSCGGAFSASLRVGT
jgi:LacI family transcriptional regulator